MPVRSLTLPIAHVLDLVGDGIIATDVDGRILVVNRAAEAMFGYTGEELVGERVAVLIPDRFRLNHERLVREFTAPAASTSPNPAHGGEILGLRKSGDEFPLAATLSRQQIAGHTIITVALRDISARRALEAESERRGRVLEESQARLRLAMRSRGIGTWEWDIDSDLISFDGAEAALWGLTDESTLSRPQLANLVHEEDRDGFAASLTAAIETGHWYHEFRVVHPDQTGHWLVGAGDVIRDPDSDRRRMVGVSFDISDRRELEEQRQMIMSETRHRLRNVVAVMNAIVRMTGTSETSVDEYRASLLARVRAIEETQRLLLSDSAEEPLLSDLLLAELAPFTSCKADNLELSGPPVRIAKELALSTGLAFHELATNAAKYGALSRPGGMLEVCWEVASHDQRRLLSINWTEHGGPPVTPPARKGFGTELLERTFGRRPGAFFEMTYASEGLRCSVELPI